MEQLILYGSPYTFIIRPLNHSQGLMVGRCHKKKCSRTIIGYMETKYLTPLKPNGISLSYQFRDSPFVFKRLLGCIFHFYLISYRAFCKQTVETLIRCRIPQRLIWVCTVCLCPTKKRLDLYGFIMMKSIQPSRNCDKLTGAILYSQILCMEITFKVLSEKFMSLPSKNEITATLKSGQDQPKSVVLLS